MWDPVYSGAPAINALSGQPLRGVVWGAVGMWGLWVCGVCELRVVLAAQDLLPSRPNCAVPKPQTQSGGNE